MPYKNVTTESSPCSDGRLVRMHVYHNNFGLWQIFDFFYDHNGHPYAVNHKISNVYTTYYYITNLQGDVMGLTTADGTTVVSYTYDPYGKVLTTTGSLVSTLGTYNPLRYRGYVYDHETGLYYLQSRYYDPQIGRFLNADAFASTGQGILGNNMFAYCLNNPINYIDMHGFVALSCFKEYTDPFNSPWENGSAGGGTQASAMSYLFFAGLKYSNSKEISDTYTAIGELLSSGNLSDATAALDALNQEDIVKYGKNIGKIVSGAKNVLHGIAITLTPDPTPINNAAGPTTFAFGIVNVIWGIITFIVNLGGEK